MNTIEVQGTLRQGLGKKAAKAVRREGKIPAVMYGGEEVVHFTTTYKEVKDLIYTADFNLAQLKIDGKEYRCIVKDVQFHPVREDIVHIDFLQLIDDTPVKVEIPVHFKGVAEGVKQGGKLQQNLRRVKVKVMPQHLVGDLWVDVTHLKMGQSVRVRDIEVPEGVEILSSMSIPVAIIEVPRALRSAAAKEAASASETVAEEAEA